MSSRAHSDVYYYFSVLTALERVPTKYKYFGIIIALNNDGGFEKDICECITYNFNLLPILLPTGCHFIPF